MGAFDQFGTRLAENLGLTNPLDALRQGHPVPAYQVLVDGKDISATIRPRLMSMTITDNRGFTADTIELTLDDSDGLLDMPRRGATLRALIGWQGQALVDKGTYKIDEVEHSGAPDAHHTGQVSRPARRHEQAARTQLAPDHRQQHRRAGRRPYQLTPAWVTRSRAKR